MKRLHCLNRDKGAASRKIATTVNPNWNTSSDISNPKNSNTLDDSKGSFKLRSRREESDQ